jgi:hypothetical protein
VSGVLADSFGVAAAVGVVAAVTCASGGVVALAARAER